ncbi:hypothetical protein ACP70R_019354 [Stipagrostis hirtigluma subsp. patula]
MNTVTEFLWDTTCAMDRRVANFNEEHKDEIEHWKNRENQLLGDLPVAEYPFDPEHEKQSQLQSASFVRLGEYICCAKFSSKSTGVPLLQDYKMLTRELDKITSEAQAGLTESTHCGENCSSYNKLE